MPALHHIVKDTKKILGESGRNTVVEINDLNEDGIRFITRHLKDYDIKKTVYVSPKTFDKKTYTLHIRRQD